MIFLMKFLKLCVKYWPFVLLIGLILYAGWTYHSMRMEIAKLQNALFECAVDNEAIENERDEVVASIDRQNSALMNLYSKNREYEMEIERLKMQRPERITEYRDVIKEVEREVISNECVEAIRQAAKILKKAGDEEQ